MWSLRGVLQLGGAFLLLIAGLTAAQAGDRVVATTNAPDAGEERQEMRSDLSELRSRMTSAVSGGYEQGPTCGCNAYGAPSCCCEASCGCDAGCGCAPACCEDNCCDCCGLPGCSCGFYAAGEVAWLRASWSSFPAVLLNSNTAPRRILGYDYDYEATPKLTIGYTGCNGLGLRASWWEFDNDSDFITAVPVTGNVIGKFLQAIGATTALTAQQSLELKVGDFEFTNCFQACGGQMVVGFGIRYARLDLAIRERHLASGVVDQLADYTQTFDGLGPTVGLEFIRPLCFSGLSFYSKLRGSVVVGDTHYQDAARTAGGALLGVEQVQDGHEPLLSTDVEIALQYCKAGWFVRGGWQAQYWSGIGYVPRAAGGGAFDSDQGRPSLSFDGFGLTVGVQY